MVYTLALKNVCIFKINETKENPLKLCVEAHFPQQTGLEETIPAWGYEL